MSEGFPPNYEYTLEKLQQAVDSLAAGEGDARARLVDAYVPLCVLEDSDFPPRSRRDFRTLMKRLTKFKSLYPRHGDVEESCRRMRKVTGANLAMLVVHLRDAVGAEVPGV